jgi:uncharacterized phage-associated protein
MANVADIAAYVLDRQGSATTWELQKLVYYAHGWSLAWDGAGLVDGPFEAWKNGPVSRPLYALHAGRRRLLRGEVHGTPASLSASQRETIDAVINFYGALGAEALVELSHRERPWREARGALAPEERSSAQLDSETIRGYFERLAQGSREKRIPVEVRRGVRMALSLSEDELEELDGDDGDLVGEAAERWLSEICDTAS